MKFTLSVTGFVSAEGDEEAKPPEEVAAAVGDHWQQVQYPEFEKVLKLLVP